MNKMDADKQSEIKVCICVIHLRSSCSSAVKILKLIGLGVLPPTLLFNL